MKFFKIAAAAIFSMFVFAVPASATIANTVGPLAGAPGQNSNPAVVDFLNQYLCTTYSLCANDVVYVGKLNPDGTVSNLNSIIAGEGGTLTGTGLGGKSGNWTFNQGTSSYEIVAIQVTGGSNAATYLETPSLLIPPGALAGDWNTDDIVNGGGNHPNLSHIEFYAREITHTHKAPEPVSLFLMGGGLAGFGFMRKKKRA
jgi:hypothetical protein